MTTERRRKRDIRTHADGSVWDHDTLKWYLDSLVKPQPVVRRLSKTDPEIAAFEATSRGTRAA